MSGDRPFAGKTVALRPTQKDGVYNIIFRTTLVSTIDLTAPIGQS